MRRPLLSHIISALVLPAMLMTSAGIAQTSRLSSPAWRAFAVAAAQYDSMQTEFKKMEQEDPELRTNQAKMQQRLQKDMGRIQAIIQGLTPLAGSALKEAIPLDNLTIDDIRIVKLAGLAGSDLRTALAANLRLITFVHDKDSLSQLKFETAFFHASSGEMDKAESYVTADVLEGKSEQDKSQLYALLSVGNVEAGQLIKGRHYAMMTIMSLGGQRAELGAKAAADTSNRAQAAAVKQGQDQFFIARIAGVLAPLTLQYRIAKDSANEGSLLEESRLAVADPSVWTAVEVAVQRDVAQKMKERDAVNKPASEWPEHRWISTEPLSVASLKGRVVLVDFFATWCRPCISAFPHLREWSKKYAAEGLMVVSLTNYQGRYDGAEVDADAEFAKLRDDFVKKHEVTWAVGVEKGGRKTFDAYGVNGIPHVVLIDRKGEMRYMKVGAGDFEQTEKMIKTLLAEKP